MSGVFSQYKVIMLHVTCGEGSEMKNDPTKKLGFRNNSIIIATII